jgi:hypothetical protein
MLSISGRSEYTSDYKRNRDTNPRATYSAFFCKNKKKTFHRMDPCKSFLEPGSYYQAQSNKVYRPISHMFHS